MAKRKLPNKTTGVSSAWVKLLGQIPGYDSSATAGDCTFDPDPAKDALEFFPKYLRHVKGEKGGEPFALEPWLQAVTANIFGWKRPDGMRRYREVFFYVPRKNAKTFWSAGCILFVLSYDQESGAEIYSAAADRDQASLVFAHAKGMVAQDPRLAQRFKIYETSRAIVCEASGSSYKVISADANTKHGFNSHMIVIDELHAQPNRELADVLMTSTGARRQPLIIHTTTSDFERPSICNEKYDYACKVRDGIIDDPSFLPVIYEAQLTEDWTDPAIWAKANPNLGKSISLEYMQRECKRAQETPSYQNTFKRLHLNIKTEQDVRWLSIEDWDACQSSAFDRDELREWPCFAGLDLASTADLCALVLYFPALHAVLPFFWLPAETADLRLQRARVPYPAWIRQGFITATEGNVADYDVIRRDIQTLATQFRIMELAYDRWGATQLITQLQGDGITTAPDGLVPYGQGFASMSAPSKELERLILSKELRHDGNPVLRWNVSNVMIETDAAGNIKPSKRKSSEKIDGVVAMAMAIGRAIVAAQDQGSIYDQRGLILL